MGYSLGDNKESYDIYDETINILNKISDALISKGWNFNEKEYVYEKNGRCLILEPDQDHLTTLCLSDKSIDYTKFCNKNNRYEIILDFDDSVYGVCFDVSKNTNITEIVKDIENAPLKIVKNNKHDMEL